mgnify:CR=1 FL=1
MGEPADPLLVVFPLLAVLAALQPIAIGLGGAQKIEDDGSGAQKILDFLVERKLV